MALFNEKSTDVIDISSMIIDVRPQEIQRDSTGKHFGENNENNLVFYRVRKNVEEISEKQLIEREECKMHQMISVAYII